MDIKAITLTIDEIQILKGRTERFADWIFNFVAPFDQAEMLSEEDKNKIKAERENIKSARKHWWNAGDYKKFLDFPHKIEFELGIGSFPLEGYKHLAKLLVARIENNFKKECYYHYLLAEVYYYDAADQFFIELGVERLNEAIREYKIAEAMDPQNVQIRYALICINSIQGVGRIEELIKETLDMLRINPEDATDFSNSQKALSYYKKIALPYSIGLLPEHKQYKTLKEVIKQLKKIVSEDPDNSAAKNELTKLQNVEKDSLNIERTRKMFKNCKKKDKKEKDVPRLQGRVIELQEAQRHMEKERWQDALEILEKILALPDDLDAAVKHLRLMMEETKLFGTKSMPIEKDDSGQLIGKIRFTMGGGMVPTVMIMRGDCINMALVDRGKEMNISDEFTLTKDPNFVALTAKGLQHAQIVSLLFQDSSEMLTSSGQLLHCTGYFKEAIAMLGRALYLDPNNMKAKEFIQLAMEREKQYSID